MKLAKKIIPFFLFFVLTSMTIHKFYIAIHQVNFAPKNKRIEITSRLFIDDINDALEKKYATKTYLGSDQQSVQDVELLKKYFSEKFIINVNGLKKPMNFITLEKEDNVIVCYLTVKDISKITSIEVENSMITEIHSDQQNIIQLKINDLKKNLLLTDENIKGMLKI
jgi:hypothetical protein